MVQKNKEQMTMIGVEGGDDGDDSRTADLVLSGGRRSTVLLAVMPSSLTKGANSDPHLFFNCG